MFVEFTAEIQMKINSRKILTGIYDYTDYMEAKIACFAFKEVERNMGTWSCGSVWLEQAILNCKLAQFNVSSRLYTK